MKETMLVRDMQPQEFEALGRLMVETYSQLDGFPKPDEQPRYYDMLANIGRFAEKKDARVLVALVDDERLAGGVVYFADMSEYGSGGTATQMKHASGIRLLAVDPACRGRGIGRALTNACIALAREQRHTQVVLHTTQAMQTAWQLYTRMGFQRFEALDFMQEQLPVYGFRLMLTEPGEAE